MEVFSCNGTRYNLVNSAVLDLLDFIRDVSLRIAHLVP